MIEKLSQLITDVRTKITDNKAWQTERDNVLTQLQAAESQLTELSHFKANHETVVTDLNTQIVNLKSELEHSKQSHSTEIETLKNSHATELKAKDEAVESKVSIGIQKQLASMNLTTNDLPPVVEEQSNIYNEWKAMPETTLVERRNKQEFFAKNKAAINLAAQGK